MNISLKIDLQEAVSDVRRMLPKGAAPTVGLILGSGLGSFTDSLDQAVSRSYRDIHGFLIAKVEGHAGNLVYGVVGETQLLALSGRAHYYEGHAITEVVFPARVLIAAGCQTLVITNAAGALDPTLRPGQIVVISDHLNLMGTTPLRGDNDASIGPRFPDMTSVYNPELRQIALEEARALGAATREGIYAALSGPQYETPAEVRMLRTLGADLVGMSTAPEVIACAHMGAKVLGLSCVTNLAAGITGEKLSHDEVTETAARVRSHFQALLRRILTRIGQAAKKEGS